MTAHLALELSADKTLITHPTEETQFLGYQLRSKGGRRKSLRLEIPQQAKQELLTKVNHLCRFHHMEEVDLIIKVNRLLRGWMEYYKYADAPQRVFEDINNQVFWMVAHYLARRHKTSIPQILKTYYRAVTTQGRTRKTLRKVVQGKTFALWNTPPQTGDIYKVWGNPAVDEQPLIIHEWANGRSIEERLEALEEANYQCESCGARGRLVAHHVGGLRRKTGKALVQAGQDKQRRVLCETCHLEVGHQGSFAPRTQEDDLT